ncbi:flagellar biosynthetic protein FliO [Nocardioides pacificus]
MLELTLRLAFSLAAVLGLLMLLAKLTSRRFRGSRDALIQIVQRQALSRSSSVSVVTVGSRVLVLGVTEQQIRVLAELEPDEIEDFETEADTAALALLGDGDDSEQTVAKGGTKVARIGATTPSAGTGPLVGSVLSPQTWRQAFTAASRRTS